jgi:hypothetical protein
MNMATGLKMMVITVLAITFQVVFVALAIAGDVIFSKLVSSVASTGIPLTFMNYDTFQQVAPFYYFLILATDLAIMYRLYEEAVSDVNSYPGL